MTQLSYKDPYDIPPHLIPPGIVYQWVSKKSFGAIDKQYQTMLDAGWIPVPALRHRELSYLVKGQFLECGGQVLMERRREKSHVSRDKEMDRAHINSNSGRNVAVNIVARVKLTTFELEEAASKGMSSARFVSHRIEKIAAGESEMELVGGNGFLHFMPPRTVRIARFRWLRWLFNLVSVEDAERDIDYD